MREPEPAIRPKPALQFEEYEPRLAMASQILAAPSEVLNDESGQSLQTLSAAHDLSGLTGVRGEFGLTGRGQTVAVIDTGIGYDHPALGGGYGAGYRVVGGWDFRENDANPYDDGPQGSHGTHVAGIIGSSHTVYRGVAPGVDLVALRVFNDSGEGDFGAVERALQWVHQNRYAFAHPITTVNLSIGGNWNSDSLPSWAMLEEELAQLKADGMFVAVAAGNAFSLYNAAGLTYPAASSFVVPVSSVDSNGALSSFSQRHARAIAAPGRSIVSTVPDYRGDNDGLADDFRSYSGTSMAAPYLAGSSVLIRQAMQIAGRTGITQDSINQLLRSTADTIFDSATNQSYLRLNLARAINALIPNDDFGSQSTTAQPLGTLIDTRTIAGMIGRVSDRDYFRFVAGHTGRITLSANTNGELQPTWELVGGLGTTSGVAGGTFSFQVDAGRSYTISLGTGAGVGAYQLTFSNVDATTYLFDEAFYLRRNPDVRMAIDAGRISSSREHFLRFGQFEGRQPSVVFDEAFYLNRHADVRQAVQQGRIASGFAHYVGYGQFEGRQPSAAFNEAFYLQSNADVRDGVQQGRFLSGAEHFVRFGQFEGRAPSAQYHEAAYLNRYADVRFAVNAGIFATGFEHYALFGRHEGRTAMPNANSPQATSTSLAATAPVAWAHSDRAEFWQDRADGPLTWGLASLSKVEKVDFLERQIQMQVQEMAVELAQFRAELANDFDESSEDSAPIRSENSIDRYDAMPAETAQAAELRVERLLEQLDALYKMLDDAT